MTISIRPATPEDHNGISIAISSAYEHDHPVRLATTLRSASQIQQEIVAEADGVICGYVALIRLDAPQNWAAITLLSVSAGHRKKGLGQKLVVAAKDSARENKLDALVAQGGENFFQRFGFEKSAAANLRSNLVLDDLTMYAIRPGTALAAEKVVYPRAYFEA